jgi:hypothetical protein
MKAVSYFLGGESGQSSCWLRHTKQARGPIDTLVEYRPQIFV